MNCNRLAWSFIWVLALFPPSAFSGDLTIYFNGKFVAATCNFSVNSGKDVDIGTYQNTYFSTNTATRVEPIALTATGCTSGISTIHMRFAGTADTSNAGLFAINSTSSVRGVAIELLYNSLTTRLSPNTTVNWIGVNPSLPSSTWNFGAHFYKTVGAITPGTVGVPITVTFTYN
jgi:type 1 fimbria pilin